MRFVGKTENTEFEKNNNSPAVYDYRRRLGKAGEERAAVYLDSIGYEILERNFRCRFGEIDIIAKDGDTICFVEVKTRSRTDHGLPCQAVDRKKILRIKRCAYVYLSRSDIDHKDIRIDIIELLYREGGFSIRHLKNGRNA